MKNKAIISLIMIVAMVLGMTVAQAATDWSASGSIGSPDWATSGDFTGSIPSVYATSQFATASHAVSVGTSKNFSFSATFKVQGENTSAFFGINTADNDAGEILVGYGAGDGMLPGPYGYIADGNMSNFIDFNAGNPMQGSTHTVKIVSTDGGQTATISVDGTSASKTVSLNGAAPKSVVIYLDNAATASPSASNVPVVTAISFSSADSTSSPTATPTISPTPTPTTNPTKTDYALNLQAIRDFYAKQPVGHMSNQSVVYNPDGSIKQVITGNQAVTTPTATATPATNNTTQPTVTPSKVPTVTPTTTSATPVPPTPTKAQSPGFEIVLAAIGMISALVLITRKKK
jgi:hypothetical protein